MKIISVSIGCLVIFFLSLIVSSSIPGSVLAQTESPSTLYVPLIGLTAVPDPLALPKGEGDVTYHYAVKNFLPELALSNVTVTDDSCASVKFTEGDDNHDSQLDYNETWRYTCKVKLSQTTRSTATAMGTANSITATHRSYATVVVGSNDPPPLVSIVNITKVAYPLSLPKEGGQITYTYKVNNPGVVPLSNVTVTDNKCPNLSGKLGDTNVNNLLDTNEVWIYNCTATLTQTTTNTVEVTAFANGLKAVDDTTLTVKVETPQAVAQSNPNLPNTGGGNTNFKVIIWVVLSGILGLLIVFYGIKSRLGMAQKKAYSYRKR